METTLNWLVRLARFDYTAFDEIRADASATTSAVLIVVFASFLAGIGSWLWVIFSPDLIGVDKTDVLIRSTLLGFMVQTMGWFLWVYIVHWLLNHMYHASSNYLELARVMGFAFFPVALSILIAIGGLAVPIGIIAFGWTLLLSSVAVQSATDAEAPAAMTATLVGFAGFMIFMGGFANVMEVGRLGGLAPGILFFSLDF